MVGDSTTPEAGETQVLVSLSLLATRVWARCGTCAFPLFRLHDGTEHRLHLFVALKKRNWEKNFYGVEGEGDNALWDSYSKW